MIYPIYIYGQPVLREVAADITKDYPELDKLIADMRETLAHSGGIGLAAPQIGLSIRVVIMDLDLISDDYPAYKDFSPIYINAHIVEYDDKETETSDEGCLSLPGLSEPVRRPKRIRVQWLDEKFEAHDEWIDGYLAVVMQHEFDHLEGKLYIDHLSAFRKTLIKKKLQSLIKGDFDCSYKCKVRKPTR